MTGRVAKAVRRATLVGVIALTAVGAGGLWLARSDWGQRWLATQVRAALGPSVHFVAARLTPWPPPLAVELDGVELLGADGAPVARALRVVGRVRLRALLGRPPLLARVVIDGAEAELTRAADGHLDLGGRPLAGGGGGAARPGLDALCPRVDVSGGRVTLRDTGTAGAPVVEIADISARLVPTRPGARLALDGRSEQVGSVRALAHLDSLGALATAPFRVELEVHEADAGALSAWLPRGGDALTMRGRGRLTATLSGRPSAVQVEAAITLHEGGRIAWRDQLEAVAPIELAVQGRWGAGPLATAAGHIDIAQARAAGLVAREVRAAFSADADGVTLTDATWQALGGQWRQSGSVRLADGVTLAGALDADAVDGAAAVAALRPLLGEAGAPLRLDGAARVHLAASGLLGGAVDGQVAVSLPAGSAGWATATARGPLAIDAGVSIRGDAVAVRDGHAQAATVGDRDLTATTVDARFGFADGVVRIDALIARAFDGDWSVSGTVPLQGAPTLAITATGINAAHLARALLTGRHEDTGTAGDVDVTATLRGGGGTIGLRLASPTLTFGPLQIAQPATASGTLAWSAGAVRVGNGRAQLDRVRIAGTDVAGVRAAFASAGPDRLRIAPLTARAFGGAWTLDATLARDTIDATVRADGVRLDPLLAALDAGPRSQDAVASFTAAVQRPHRDGATVDVGVQLTRGRFLFDDLTVVAPARGTGTVRLQGSRWSVADGHASAAAASYAWIRATQASAGLDFDADHIQFADLRATLAGASWQGSGRIDLSSPPRIDGAVAVTRADPDTLLALAGVNAPTLDPDGLDLDLRARGALAPGWRQDLEGSGRLALRGGTLNSTALLRAVVAAIVPSRLLRDAGSPNHLRQLTMTFTLGAGSARTEDLRTTSDDYDLSGAGAIGLDGSIDLDSRVTLTPNGIKKIFALSAVPLPGSSMLSLPTIPVRIDGTLADPHVHPEAGALAGATARWFVDSLVGAPQAVGAAVGRPLERAFDGMRNLFDPRTPTPPP